MSNLNLPQIATLPSVPSSSAKPTLARRQLPTIGSQSAMRPAPHIEVTNPSTVSPSTQQFIAPVIDQTKKVTRVPGGIAHSNGEIQRLDLAPGQQGVLVTEMPMFRGSFRGERYQQPNHAPLDQGVRVRIPAGSKKPVVNVDVSSQNVSRPRPTRAVALPTATTVHAGRTNNAGLPTNHNIK